VVLVAILLGVALGAIWPSAGARMEPLSKGFINLIKMLIAPVVFTTVVVGIAGMGDMRRVGRVGLKALLYFEAMTTLALLIGLLVVNLVRPGGGLEAAAGAVSTTEIAKYQRAGESLNAVDFVLHIIPESVVGAFARGDILQVLVFSVLFGLALAQMGEDAASVVAFIERVSHALFGVVRLVMYLAPLGAFGAMAYTVGKYGISSLGNLAMLMACVYLTCLLFVFAILGAMLRLTGLSIFRFVRYIRNELLIVLGTSSSEAALPPLMERLEECGCPRAVVGLVVPTGYSFNLDGTSIYLTMAAVFLAQATNTPLDLGQQLSLLFILMLTSKGAAAVTGGGFITLAATLSALHTLPVSSLQLLFGVDRFMSEARALTNIVGNGVATLVVSRWEGELDPLVAREVMEGVRPPLREGRNRAV
jgi:aerobic C4-dicarboxylate transport protein